MLRVHQHHAFGAQLIFHQLALSPVQPQLAFLMDVFVGAPLALAILVPPQLTKHHLLALALHLVQLRHHKTLTVLGLYVCGPGTLSGTGVQYQQL